MAAKISDKFEIESEMFERLCKPLVSRSFFVFGARGTGKSTLVRAALQDSRVWVLDLLVPDVYERFAGHPQLLISEARAKAPAIDWILIDEVQKLPQLLDSVHSLMTTNATAHLHFALTGSSARKLKLVGANLLAGRAFHNELHPLTARELGSAFDLGDALNWGTLPEVWRLPLEVERQEFLRTYVRNYLKEEVWDERLVQNLDPFRKFIEIAAQSSGTIVNFSKLARQTGVSDKMVKKYFDIVVDTFLGFYLEPYARSVRSQQISSPKFYLFDTGVKRAAEGLITVPIVAKTYAFGRAFEHFVICEVMRLNAYLRRDFRLSFLKTKDDAEIDLIVERPGQATVLVEIKSSSVVDESDSKVLKRFLRDFPDAKARIWATDPNPKLFGDVLALAWQDGVSELFAT
jgi:predicted AAA+ superfamily ATPase